MLSLTKIFNFEMAHAIYGYAGSCKNVHGHSYELHVTLSSATTGDEYISAPGFEIDFKEIKELVNVHVIKSLDHKMVLSKVFIASRPVFKDEENLEIWDAEPTAENLLIYIHRTLEKHLPGNTKLTRLTIYETRDSYAEWVTDS